MGLPVVPIISAVTPLVLGAFDLYRRRTEAKATQPDIGPTTTAREPAAVADALRARMHALEESDLEQAHLISELSRQVETLARAVESHLAEARRREARQRLWLYALTAATGVAVLLGLRTLGA